MRDRQKNGWSSPRLISFNLKECRDGEILKRLEDLLRVERAQRGIPEPAMNQNRSNRKIYAGRSFTEIEALDAWTRLPRRQAAATGLDEAQSRSAKRLIKAHLGKLTA